MSAPAPETLAWVNDFVGVPYLVNGRDRDGWDCWGVVLAVFREQRGVTLPDWRRGAPYDLAAQARAFGGAWAEAQAAELAVRVEHPEHWSIALVARHRLPHHVGVVLGAGVLHCAEKSAGTVYEPLSRFDRNYPGATWWRWTACEARDTPPDNPVAILSAYEGRAGG
jgi:cell wall-associated NlpC family hydrolase